MNGVRGNPESAVGTLDAALVRGLPSYSSIPALLTVGEMWYTATLAINLSD